MKNLILAVLLTVAVALFAEQAQAGCNQGFAFRSFGFGGRPVVVNQFGGFGAFNTGGNVRVFERRGIFGNGFRSIRNF